MKRIIVLLLFWVGTLHVAHAQTWNEWFRQKQTQKKYLLKQIAALKVFIEYARKGAKIANNGLNLIRKIKKGDFNIHDEFFASFKSVNPRIKNYGKVAVTIALQTKIIKEAAKTIPAMRESKQFTPDEVEYCQKVFDRLLTDCLNCVNELYLVITADQLELKDDERIKHINRLYADMQNKHSFCASFNEEIGTLSMQRQSESADIKFSKIINELP